MDILTVFFDIDEFCYQFEPLWKQHLLSDGNHHRNRERTLSLSEVMTIMVLFHTAGYRNLKQFYLEFVSVHLRREFPALVSYPRFVQFESEALLPLAAYLQTRAGNCTGISFVDATRTGCVRKLENSATSAVCFDCASGQNLDRLVLWLQVAFDR